MQTVVIIPEPEWRQWLARVEKLEEAESARYAVAAAAQAEADEVLDVRRAAAYIGLSPEALRRARRAGRIKGVRLNEKDWGFRRAILDSYPRRYHRAAA